MNEVGVAAAVALLLTACGTPDVLTLPTLEPDASFVLIVVEGASVYAVAGDSDSALPGLNIAPDALTLLAYGESLAQLGLAPGLIAPNAEGRRRLPATNTIFAEQKVEGRYEFVPVAELSAAAELFRFDGVGNVDCIQSGRCFSTTRDFAGGLICSDVCEEPRAPEPVQAPTAPDEPEKPDLTPCTTTEVIEPETPELPRSCRAPQAAELDCPPNTAAYATSTACEPLGTACPQDGFPSNMPASGVLYVSVDAALGGDGDRTRPYRAIHEALSAATAGATIAIGIGTYVESVLTLRDVTLRGACVSGTRVRAVSETGRGPIQAHFGRSHVSNMTLESDRHAVVVHPTIGLARFADLVITATSVDENVVLLGGNSAWERVRIQSRARSFRAQHGARVELRQVMMEGALEGDAVYISGGSSVHLNDLRIIGRHPDDRALPNDQGVRGAGILLDESTLIANLIVVEDIRGSALAVSNSTVSVAQLEVRRGRPSVVQAAAIAVHRSNVALDGVRISDSEYAALGLSGDAKVRWTRGWVSGGANGGGIGVHDSWLELSKLRLENTVGFSTGGGAELIASDLWVTGTRGITFTSTRGVMISRARFDIDETLTVPGSAVLVDTVVRDLRTESSSAAIPLIRLSPRIDGYRPELVADRLRLESCSGSCIEAADATLRLRDVVMRTSSQDSEQWALNVANADLAIERMATEGRGAIFARGSRATFRDISIEAIAAEERHAVSLYAVHGLQAERLQIVGARPGLFIAQSNGVSLGHIAIRGAKYEGILESGCQDFRLEKSFIQDVEGQAFIAVGSGFLTLKDVAIGNVRPTPSGGPESRRDPGTAFYLEGLESALALERFHFRDVSGDAFVVRKVAAWSAQDGRIENSSVGLRLTDPEDVANLGSRLSFAGNAKNLD